VAETKPARVEVPIARPQFPPDPAEFERLRPFSADITDQFHRLIYASEVWLAGVTWRGVPVHKIPTDLWLYQELVYEVQPDLIIETGTAEGGSAAFFASLLDLNGHGRIITIDTRAAERPRHPRVEYWQGSSTDPAVVRRLEPIARSSRHVMVVLDSAHSTPHVGRELALYSPFVTLGSYVVVEDGNIDGNPVLENFVDPHDGKRGGPQAAIQAFLATTDAFEVDITRHKFFVTFNPNGYLKRVK
jgi:cephalosporin hydroxylase